jgi:hypothetical protein
MGRTWMAMILASLAGACGGGGPIAAPSGPSADIARNDTLAPLMSGNRAIVTCEGPAERIAELGDLCHFSGDPSWYPGSPMSVGIALGDATRIVIFAFAPPGSDRNASWPTDQLLYSAHLVFGTLNESGWVDEIESWSQGEALPGELGTTRFVNQACGADDWIGGGTLSWQGVTIRLAWSAGLPC